MRSLFVLAALTLAAAAPAAAQAPRDQPRTIGADSLFGPGVVDRSASGSAVKLQLTRPAHVVAIALREAGLAQLVLPRRPETRLSRVGDQWIDLPWPVAGGPGPTTTAVGRSGSIPRTGRSRAAAMPADAASPSGAGTVILVVVADSAWSRDTIIALLQRERPERPIEGARALAAALLAGRADTCAAYFVGR